MSVINQMLKELDQRKTGNKTVPDVALPMNNYTPPEEGKPLKIIALIAVAIIIVGAMVYGYKQQQTMIDNTEQLLTEQLLTEKEKASQSGIENTTVKIETVVSEQHQPAQELVTSIDAEQIAGVDKAANVITEKMIIAESNQPQVEDKAPEVDWVVKSKPRVDFELQALRLFEQAQQEIAASDPLSAQQLLNQALEINPLLHQARVLIFSLLLQSQQLDLLQPQLTVSLLQWPEVHEYRQLQARLFLQQNQADQALSLLQNDIPMIRQAPEYHALLAYVAQQTANDQLASKHYQALLQQQPGRADWWLGLAVSSERLGNKTLALSAYQQSLGRPGLSQSVQEYARQRLKVIQGF